MHDYKSKPYSRRQVVDDFGEKVEMVVVGVHDGVISIIVVAITFGSKEFYIVPPCAQSQNIISKSF
jgi:hypothetical protein